MFSAWDFNSWIASVGVLLVIVSLLTGFGALVNALMARIWKDENEAAATTPASEHKKDHPIRKAA
ncbi:MAG: hypothetical protein OJF52_001273 [Nitrospira sp.]|jgi:hypothetical protein|nr:MAG: hypothetical protein OJF52_001273 [Nitrospira sp.]